MRKRTDGEKEWEGEKERKIKAEQGQKNGHGEPVPIESMVELSFAAGQAGGGDLEVKLGHHTFEKIGTKRVKNFFTVPLPPQMMSQFRRYR